MLVIQPKLCSIIIPTRNEGDMLHMTVESILSQTSYESFEVIVVDDGSTDGSCDCYRQGDTGRVRVVTSENPGVARARNLGAQHASGRCLVFLDAHCKVSPNWLDHFVECLRAPDVGIVGPCFTNLDEPEPRGCGTRWTDYTLKIAWFDPNTIVQPYEVPFAPGGCQAFRRSNFYRIGRYDEGLATWGFEDQEICLRAWTLGYRVLADPRIVVAHHFRNSRGFDVADSDVLYNLLHMIYLHFSPKRIERVLQALESYPGLQQASARLNLSEVYERRAQLDAVRVTDDGWFFNAFMPDLA